MADSSTVIVDTSSGRSTVVQNNNDATRLVSGGTGSDGRYSLKESGTSTLDGLVDVSTAGRQNNDTLKYSAASGRWVPSASFIVLEAGAPVPAGLRAGTLIFRERT